MPQRMSACTFVAPIGAHVFIIERRNRSKTTVYEDLCMRVSVDTTIAADRLKNPKKGLKFDRFDVFSQPIRESWSHSGSGDGTGRETARMGGLPVDPLSVNWSLDFRRTTPQIVSSSVASALDFPSVAHLCGRPRGVEPFGMAILLRRPSAGSRIGLCPGIHLLRFGRRVGSNLPGPGSNDSGARFPTQSADMSSDQAQIDPIECGTALAMGLGEGWDDCSTSGKPAGRDNEETA